MRFFCRAATRHRAQSPRSAQRSSLESGFAYLLALFLMLLMITVSMAVLMNMRTQGRRQREDQMIWRGNQFTVAIRRYYRRAGRFPQNLDELQKGVANVHFLRPEALVDPMNSEGDGKWRFIYTNPAGQILGSTRYATMQQMAILDLNGGQPPRPPDSDSGPGAPASDETSSTNCAQPGNGIQNANAGQFSVAPIGSAPGSGFGPANALSQLQNMSPGQVAQAASQSGLGSQSGFSLGQNQTGTSGNTCGGGVPGALGLTPESLKALMDMKPTGPVDSPVIGGYLVGVGSTVDRTSVKVYHGGKKYNEWEFIYNPIEEQARAIQQGINQSGGSGFAGGLAGLNLGNGLPGPTTTSGAQPGSSPMQAPPATQQPQPSQPQQPEQQQQPQ
jgi:hypothetical protein